MEQSHITIIRPQLADLDHLVRLFDQYRVFYQQASDLDAAAQFLRNRLVKQDSTIYAAQADDQLIGFTQLYPSFSSVSMKAIWILNDLFVSPAYRNQGVARKLIEMANHHAHATGAVRLALSTQHSNHAAQQLYESIGYERDTEFIHYAFRVQ
ncbi:MAG: GNAT family N-acetyltransferase [Cyanobacteria bacterium P01_E01_bin.6]